MTLFKRLQKLEDQEAARRAALEAEWERVFMAAASYLTEDERTVLIDWSERSPEEAHRERDRLEAWFVEECGPFQPLPADVERWMEDTYNEAGSPRPAPAGTSELLKPDVQTWRELRLNPACPESFAAHWQAAMWSHFLAFVRVLGEERA